MQSMKWHVFFLSLFITLIVFLGVHWSKNPPHTKPILFHVHEGESLSHVSKRLSNEKIIGSPYLFISYGKLNQLDKSIQAGEFYLPKGGTYKEIYTLLTKPMRLKVHEKIVIPEGFTVEQIARRLQKHNVTMADEFLKVAKTGEGIESHVVKTVPKDDLIKYRLEGYLFPSTYYFKKHSSATDVAQAMVNRFEIEMKKLSPADGSVHRLVTLASIIEKETAQKDEQAIISGIFYNRMNHDWKLESCATVQYVLNKRKERLTYNDLALNHPYNTYRHKGLPPGPIANPGLDALKAAQNPKKSDYFFFVAKQDGTRGHYFSKTFLEHTQHTKKTGND